MKKVLIATLLLAASLPLVADDAKKANTISVNGVTITQPMFQYLANKLLKPGQKITEEVRQALLNEIVQTVLLAQDALKNKLDQNPVHAANLKMERLSYLSNAAALHKIKEAKITDKQAKALYKEKFSKGTQEFNARHILVKEEKEAEKLIAELKKGGDFAELAKKHSTGPTGAKGGDLGWFPSSRMVKPFGDALATMKKGSYSEKPVKTEFGWHVIKLEDTREIPARSYDELKDSLKATLQRDVLKDYVKGLFEKAEIKPNN